MEREKKKESARLIRVQAEQQGIACDITGTASQSLSRSFSLPLTVVYGESETEARQGMKELMRRVNRGTDFINGPKGPRQDALSRIIEEVYGKLSKRKTDHRITAADILRALRQIASHDGVICEVEDDGTIYRYNGSKEKCTTYKSFLNRLTKIKKDHSEMKS